MARSYSAQSSCVPPAAVNTSRRSCGSWPASKPGRASSGPASSAGPSTATGGPISTNWRSTLEAVTPPVTGVRVSVVDLSQRLKLSNAGPTEVMVLGYHGEPYLRVGPAGVFENVRSPAHFLNRPGAVAGT